MSHCGPCRLVLRRVILSERSALSPGKRLHHQRSCTGTPVDTRWCHKYPLNSAFLDTEATPHLRRLQPDAPHSSFGMCLEMTQHASRRQLSVVPFGREREQLQACKLPRSSPWSHQRHGSPSVTVQAVMHRAAAYGPYNSQTEARRNTNTALGCMG
jgi:hypothetical protein